ncbi:hypothetical protein BMT55_08205 [Listeria newyorkensis]|uniref:HTH cro/C1-type domain-containing protein n=1 Tax=Listeria newyorkensis TaxID=1497681 RepID=A0ABX4XN44_9LIST|nr:helix-turn-helix transcriptional regulator [Listeria newyorkensis]PNP92541.1 hypothetical protein BMT55_08205 [Listeria newyorkensis]
MKQIRADKKFSQEELSLGICHINTIVKIESNKVAPSFELLLALVNRLGVSIDDVIKRARLMNNALYMEQKALLEKCMENHDMIKLERYARLIDEEVYTQLPIVEQQFLDIIEVSILLDNYQMKEKALRLVKQSLQKTHRDASTYFTREESLLINLLLKIEQSEEHIQLAQQAYTFISKQNVYLQDKHGYIILATGLMYTAYIQKDWFRVLEYATVGEKIAVEMDKLRFMPNFIFMQGLAMYLLETDMEQGLSEIKRALDICKFTNRQDNYNDLLEHAKSFDIIL